MRLDDYDTKDGKRVWLSSDEIELLIDEAQSAEQRIAFTLGGRAGLRRSEIVSVTPNDFTHGPNGFVRVWGDYAKRDKYREAPIPNDFEAFVRGVTQSQPPDKPVLYNAKRDQGINGTTVYRWVRRAAERLQAETGDSGWSYLDVHDLRRSWGGHLLWNCGVLPAVVMEFGGWTDYQTFEEHYLGEITPEAQQRERSKIDYVGGDPETDTVAFNPRSTGAQQAYGQR
jgi:integrase